MKRVLTVITNDHFYGSKARIEIYAGLMIGWISPNKAFKLQDTRSPFKSIEKKLFE